MTDEDGDLDEFPVFAWLQARPRIGLFTTTETITNAFGHERYCLRSRWHRRAFGGVVVGTFLIFFLLTLFAADAFLVG